MSANRADEKLVLVSYEQGYKFKRRIRWLVSVTALMVVAYWVGAWEYKQKHESTLGSLERLSAEYDNLLNRETELIRKVTKLENSRAIDDQAQNQIQGTIMALKDEVKTLQKDLTFYQNIMAPADNVKGLQVQSAELEAKTDNRRYAYKVVLAQLADNKSFVKGVVAINLVGSRGDKQEVIPLRDVSELTDLGIKFRFRYFQNVIGELQLPEDFTPERIQVVAQSEGKKASRIEQSFKWQDLLLASS